MGELLPCQKRFKDTVCKQVVPVSCNIYECRRYDENGKVIKLQCAVYFDEIYKARPFQEIIINKTITRSCREYCAIWPNLVPTKKLTEQGDTEDG